MKSVWKKYSYLWITLILFAGSLLGHWVFAWKTYVSEQKEHNAPIVRKDYIEETLRDTFENWQSEFLQLIWQVAGLSIFFFVGSSQSKEGDDRKEEKIDLILAAVDRDAKDKIKKLEEKYPKK